MVELVKTGAVHCAWRGEVDTRDFLREKYNKRCKEARQERTGLREGFRGASRAVKLVLAWWYCALERRSDGTKENKYKTLTIKTVQGRIFATFCQKNPKSSSYLTPLWLHFRLPSYIVAQ